MDFPAEHSLHRVHFHSHFRQHPLCYFYDDVLACILSRGSERLLAGK